MAKSRCVPHVPFSSIKRCGAKARQNGHKPCRQPAMANGRCRLHGGKSTGPKTSKGKIRSAQANFRHGMYTTEAMLERRRMQLMMAWRKEMSKI